jgi:hypothetical protein
MTVPTNIKLAWSISFRASSSINIQSKEICESRSQVKGYRIGHLERITIIAKQKLINSEMCKRNRKRGSKSAKEESLNFSIFNPMQPREEGDNKQNASSCAD